MKKLVFFFSLLMSLTISTVQVWGADEVYKTALFGSSYNSKSVSGYTDTWTATNNNFTVSLSNFNNNNNGWDYVKCGRKNNASVGTITTSAAIDKAITKIDVTIDALTASKINSIKLYKSSNNSTWTEVGSYTKSTGTQSVSISSPTASLYYKIEFDCASGSSNGLITVSKVEYYKAVEVPAGTCATPTFSVASGSNVLSGTTVSLSTTTEGATIYYTMGASPADPTTNSSVYTEPIAITENTTIKAIAAKSGLTNSSVESASYTVATPLTTMDAIFSAATTAGGTATDVYVTFNNWVVSGVATNGKNVYLTDGTKGLIIFDNSGNTGFVVGNILSGTVACKVQLYNGSSELTNLISSTSGLTVTTGGIVNLNELDAAGIEALSGINTGSLIKVSGECSYQTINNKDYYYIAGVQLFTTLFTYTNPTAGNNYNCTGVYVQYNSTKEMLPRSAADLELIVVEDAPEAPTFSLAAGTYQEVKNVELSCATEGATIYYTTDGSTPDNTKAAFTTAISVQETMTIKAIAIKNGKSSSIVTATYTINLPENEETSKTWDLSVDQTASASTSELTWTGTYIDMSYAKGTSTSNANNYYPATSGQNYTSTRFYKNGVLTITPKNKQITTITFRATTSGYASALANSTWTNGSAEASGSNVIVTANNKGAVSASIGGTCGFTEVRVDYVDIDASIPNDPTFSPVAGTYTEVQSVEISCTTQGATIYYTTDGSTPDNTKTEYTVPISVGENMTIKAIALKDSKSSSVVTAAYVINLPEDEETAKTWDLSIVSCDDNPTDELMQWTSTYVTMAIAKGSGTKVTNYYPGTEGKSYTSTRFYNNNTLTFTPNGKQITNITFTAASSDYASVLANSTWTNGSAEASGSNVIVTVTSPGIVSAAITGTCGVTAVRVAYTTIDLSIPDNPTFSVDAGIYTSIQSVELDCTMEDATIYYTTDGSTPDNTKTPYTTAISVGETMVIKAVAIKGSKSSSVVSATYIINLPISLNDCDGTDDFRTATNTSTSSYDVERTTTNGWSSVNAALTTISEEACWLTINGKTSAVGVITSPILNDGIASLKIRYANTFSETNGVSFTIEIKQEGEIVKSYTITKANSEVLQGAIYTETIENIRVEGDFQIVITNLCPSNNSSSNKDRVSIGKLCWTNFNPNYTDIRTDLSAGTWGTLCSAQQVDYPKGASFFTIAYVAMQDNVPTKVYFDEIAEGESLQAGQPYVFIANSDKIQGELTGDETGAGLNDHGFIGKLEDFSFQVQDGDGSRDKYYVFYGNQIRRCADGYFKLLAGRAYLDVKDPNLVTKASAAPAPAPGRRRISMDNPEAPQQYTGVDAAQVDGKPAKMFINGQLFILRDGQLYDTTGRIVK